MPDVDVALTGAKANARLGAVYWDSFTWDAFGWDGSYPPAMGVEITVAMTGISAASAGGSLAPAAVSALTGSEATTGSGFLVSGYSFTLTGARADANAGMLSPAMSALLSGLVGTTTAGSLARDATYMGAMSFLYYMRKHRRMR